MSMALICFFLIIQTISNEAILAQDENIYDDEDETSSKMQEDQNELESHDLVFSLNNQGTSSESSILVGFDQSNESLSSSFKPPTTQNQKISFRKLRKLAKSASNLDEDSDEIVDTAVLNTLFYSTL